VGGSGIQVLYQGARTTFHVHPSAEVGPALASKVMKALGIDSDELREVL
jgi:hypothetical protein